MKNTTLLILLSLFITSCGDNLVEEVKERYDDGKLKVVEYYKKVGNNQELVKKREYYKNGNIDREVNYKDGKKEGKWTTYYENGQIYEEVNYKDGKEDGKWTGYYENGQIRLERNYKYGKKEGKWTGYYENGQIWNEGNHKDGKLDGKVTGYYENGQIRGERNYKDGKYNGKWTMYHENGQIEEEVNYKDGKAEGLSKYYYHNLRVHFPNQPNKIKYRYKCENGLLQEEGSDHSAPVRQVRTDQWRYGTGVRGRRRSWVLAHRGGRVVAHSACGRDRTGDGAGSARGLGALRQSACAGRLASRRGGARAAIPGGHPEPVRRLH